MFEKINRHTANNRNHRNLLRRIRMRIARVDALCAMRPKLLLTESDFKCILYRELTQIEDFNPHYNPPLVFTELSERHYARNVATDITAYVPNTLELDLRNYSDAYITKHFFARGIYMDFELKLVRHSSNFIEGEFEDDIRKLVDMENLGEDRSGLMLYGFMIVAIRSDAYSDGLRDWIARTNKYLENQSNIELIIIDIPVPLPN